MIDWAWIGGWAGNILFIVAFAAVIGLINVGGHRLGHGHWWWNDVPSCPTCAANVGLDN